MRREIDIDDFIGCMEKEAKRAAESDAHMKNIFNLESQSKEEQEKAAAKFRTLDLDGGGTLDFEEFSKGAYLYNLTEEAAVAVFKALDENGTG